jgi:hypothetical protein
MTRSLAVTIKGRGKFVWEDTRLISVEKEYSLAYQSRLYFNGDPWKIDRATVRQIALTMRVG